MNSGRSFGRQLTSTSVRRCETTPPFFTPGDAAVALEVQRDRDADLLVLEHALQVEVQDGVLGRMPLHVLQDRGLVTSPTFRLMIVE